MRTRCQGDRAPYTFGPIRWWRVEVIHRGPQLVPLDFELNLLVFGEGICDALGRQFSDDLRGLEPLTLKSVRSTPYPLRIAATAARLLAPLL